MPTQKKVCLTTLIGSNTPSKELSAGLRKRAVDFHKSGEFLKSFLNYCRFQDQFKQPEVWPLLKVWETTQTCSCSMVRNQPPGQIFHNEHGNCTVLHNRHKQRLSHAFLSHTLCHKDLERDSKNNKKKEKAVWSDAGLAPAGKQSPWNVWDSLSK